MPLNDRDDPELSRRAASLPGSPLRALLSLRSHGETLNLGGGHPDLSLFPSGKLADLASSIIRDDAPRCLQYAPTEGFLPLREFIAARLNRRGCAVTAGQIVVTHGSQQALAAVAALLTSPDHPIALEQPGYPGAAQAFALAQAPTVSLPVTPEGWELDALRVQKVSAMYVIPSFQNPTGRKATASACRALAGFAERTGTFVIEDDAYGELDFHGEPARPVLADATSRGILLGSFSKTLCPGLRVGWIAAPERLVGPLVRVLQASSLQPGTLAQHLALRLLETLDWEQHLSQLRGAYASRAAALRARCEATGLPSEEPGGGFFLWVRTPRDATPIAAKAAAMGLVCVPESAFRDARFPGPDRHLRMAFSQYDDAAAPTQRFAEVLRAVI